MHVRVCVCSYWQRVTWKARIFEHFIVNREFIIMYCYRFLMYSGSRCLKRSSFVQVRSFSLYLQNQFNSHFIYMYLMQWSCHLILEMVTGVFVGSGVATTYNAAEPWKLKVPHQTQAMKTYKLECVYTSIIWRLWCLFIFLYFVSGCSWPRIMVYVKYDFIW
jgi:hypothetical protein